MTGNENGRCVVVPIGLAIVTASWGAALVLIGWRSLGGPLASGMFGMLACGAAVTVTLMYGQARNRHMMVQAFNYGRESGIRSMSSVR